MLYAGGGRVVRLPNPGLRLYSCRRLILQGAWLEDARHSYSGPPRTRSLSRREAVARQQATTQVPPQHSQWDTGYEGGYSEYHEGGSSHHPHGQPWYTRGAGTSASAHHPSLYSSLERDISYVADQAERVVEGIGRVKQRLEEHAHIQTNPRSSIDSQTEALNSLFGFLGFDPKA